MFFICVGDYGAGNKIQYKVAKTMNMLCQHYPIQFIVGLGDNIYPDGVKSVHSKLFYSHFEKPYSILPKDIQFLQCLGNHDYKGSVESQINYSNVSSRWYMPKNYYCVHKKINGVHVDLFAIDTNMNKLSSNQRQKQEQWLLHSLENSKARWRIVFGHHPWKSSGSHGDTKNKHLEKLFKKIIQTKQVHLILAGHDHDQQHIKIPYLPDLCVSGAGSTTRHQPDFIRKYNQPNLLYYSENPGCCLIGVNYNHLDLSFFNMYDKPEYNTKIYHQRFK